MIEIIENLINEKSQLISNAEALKVLGKIEESKNTYKLASQKEKQLAQRFFGLSKTHWISAISCLFQAKLFSETKNLIDEFLLSLSSTDLTLEEIRVLQNIKDKIKEKEVK